jgi:hypothetical protein
MWVLGLSQVGSQGQDIGRLQIKPSRRRGNSICFRSHQVHYAEKHAED